jgi:mannose-1-phosphate guanylyltransferase
MILAAGLGTRMRPLTDEIPKPLVWIGDQPMLAHVAARLAAGGVTAAALNTHHLAAAFSVAILRSLPIPITLFHEPAILGTAGGVVNAASALGEGDVVVWNGDILADLDVGDLTARHVLANAAATLAVAPRACGEGTVGLDAAGDVVRLRGELFGTETTGGDFLGIQVIDEALRRRLPAVGCLVGDGYLPALRRGERVASSVVSATWSDVGTVSAYLAANERWLARLGRAAFVGAGASIAEGVDLEGSVVGAGAIVRGRGALRGCVVWPGATATAPLDEAVITTGGHVVRAVSPSPG